MAQWVIGLLGLAVAAQARADTPVPSPLDRTPPRRRADEPARTLPRVTTACQDRAAARCWSEPGETTCPGATAFRTVIAGDIAAALADCERDLSASSADGTAPPSRK